MNRKTAVSNKGHGSRSYCEGYNLTCNGRKDCGDASDELEKCSK